MFAPSTLAQTIDAIARKAIGKDWSLFSVLLEHWKDIVGPAYADVTTPVKITFPIRTITSPKRENGKLVMRIPSGLAMTLDFEKVRIRDKINSFFGYAAISDIVFEKAYDKAAPAQAEAVKPDPTLKSRVAAKTEGVEDPDLQAALQSLGEAIERESVNAKRKP
jgi:hypothetical protein